MDSNCGSANSARNRPIPLNLLSPQGATTQSARQEVFNTHLKALLAELTSAAPRCQLRGAQADTGRDQLSRAMVRIEGAWYSVPSRWARLNATAYLGVDDVCITCMGESVTHPSLATSLNNDARSTSC